MPRFFFNIYDHHTDIDNDGLELGSSAEARAAAVVFAGDILSENPGLLEDDHSVVIEARDESGGVVVTVTIAAADGPAAAGS